MTGGPARWGVLGGVLALVSAAGWGCSGSESSDDVPDVVERDVPGSADMESDTSDPLLDRLGTLRVVAHYDGEVPADAKVAVVLFECPFSMPPVAHGEFPTAGGFPAVGDLPYIPPGRYCLMAYIDMVAGDGVHPVPGVDAEAFPEEGKTTIEVDILEGKITELALHFQFSADVPVVGDPGPEDVWLHVRILCDDCPEGGRFVLYGKSGSVLEGMPEFYVQKPSPGYPFIAVISESDFLGMKSPFPAAQVTFGAYHDVDGQGMGPETGDLLAANQTVVLQKAIYNKLVLRLK